MRAENSAPSAPMSSMPLTRAPSRWNRTSSSPSRVVTSRFILRAVPEVSRLLAAYNLLDDEYISFASHGPERGVDLVHARSERLRLLQRGGHRHDVLRHLLEQSFREVPTTGVPNQNPLAASRPGPQHRGHPAGHRRAVEDVAGQDDLRRAGRG